MHDAGTGRASVENARMKTLRLPTARTSLALLLAMTAATPTWAADVAADNEPLAAKAATIFGKQKGQSFDASTVKASATAPRTDTLSVTLAPGKGAELKAVTDAGQSFIYHWTASGDVAVDMHGDLPNAKDEYTSYAIEGAQREGSGLFTAKFDSAHGWFWLNRGKTPVTVKVTVTGFHKQLIRPSH